MQTKWIIPALLAITVASLSTVAQAGTAAESFAEGEKSLAKGEFDRALQSFAAATRAEKGNQEYAQHHAIVRRVVDLRGRLETEKNPQRWEYMARALRAFYVNERIYSEMLKLDQVIHKRLNSAESAAMLAETQLAMDQNLDAARTLSALESDKTTETTRLLLGIAQTRNGKTEEAKRIAEQVHLPKDADSSLMYTAARLHAAVGDSGKATMLLKACFENTLPSLLDGFKSHAKTCPEFAGIATTPEFLAVLKTESKLPESKCSGGSSCAGCPMRGQCPKSLGNSK